MNNQNLKIIFVTDSIANPRSFPIEEVVPLERTYPYLIRESYPSAICWQLSYGNLTTEELVNQVIGYLNDWAPDIIIVHSGINDCRPEAFTSLQKDIIKNLTGLLFRYIAKQMYNPRLIKWRSLYRVSKRSYKKTLTKFKNIFNTSKIVFIEINAGDGYERARPGVLKRIDDYNEIINEIYPEGMIRVKNKIDKYKGLNTDNIHLNAEGHRVIAELLQKKLSSLLKSSNKL
mgnify:CR=1 FL=1